jgi:Co/Zn/Cd efflux system component
MADACCSSKRDTIAELGRKAEQRRVLIIVMLINLAMFVVEFGGGVVSSALMADSVDMFGDAVVYALSLYALHRGARWEAGQHWRRVASSWLSASRSFSRSLTRLRTAFLRHRA